MAQYEIAPLTGTCCSSGQQLQPGEAFYAVLLETPEGFERRDYSLAAWQGPPEGHFCFWKSRIPEKKEKKRLLVDNDVIVNLFIRLASAEQPIKLHFRFVLGLILMRKRLLKYDRTTTHSDGRECWWLRLVADGSMHEVLNPRLTDDQIHDVSRELGAILHGDYAAFAQLTDESNSEPETTTGEAESSS